MLGEPGMGPNVVQEHLSGPPNRSNGGVSGSWRGFCTYLQQIPPRLLRDLTANAAVPAASPVQLFLPVQILEAFELKAAPATRGGQRHALA
jgi:hypothetical protein